MSEKVGKSRNTVFFQWFVAPESRKAGSLKRRVRSQLARWEMKNCTPLWREAHFEVTMYKTPPSDRFWKLRCRKSGGAKHMSKWTCTKHTIVGPLLEVEMSKKCMPLWREAHFEAKCTKHTIVGPLLEVEMSKKCTPLWREAHFEVRVYKTHHVRTTFGRSDVVPRGRRGTFEEDLHRCMFRGRHSTKNMFMRDVRSSGRWFPETGCILEHQICRFAKMILRDRCSTSYDLASIFRGRRSTLDRWSGKIAKRIGTRLSVLHSPFHFWRKSRRIVLFFDVVKFKNWRSLAELLRFGCCQGPKMKKSPRTVSFWTLLCAKIKEVSRNFFVFDLADKER